MTTLPTETIEVIQNRIASACSDPEKGLPGVSFVAVGKDGNELVSHAAGQRGYGSSEAMKTDSVFWIASCTKMITGIACMQLVEQGRLSLDDAEQVYQFCPELRDAKVLQKDGSLVEKKREITLRMLLTHTSGLGYTFFSDALRDYKKPGYDEFTGSIEDFLQPLIHQPGEAWEYGIGIDWAGALLERVTGLSLNDYFHQHIFEPLGLKHISMLPTTEMKNNLTFMNQRAADGQLSAREHVLKRALQEETKSDKSYFYSGGAGCFSTPQDYCQILTVLLNNGTSPKTGTQLLKKETVDEMFRDQISNLPPLAEKHFPDAVPELVTNAVGVHPTVAGDRQGWGLTFNITGGPTGRSLGTGQWSGLPNPRWWCDREKGVAGMICVQVLPFGDNQLFDLWQDVEAGVYRGLGLGV
ncbi:hypothetical protein ASPWEDRAFT_40575 [Aspergillus wentii DTO 134E9]|uniref:Beta-lactamase-related domain-containing protein n=1 Tax=Aspergillus wentii DTO 134E9 TaxID=1073089 RepID=A0A1L9RKE1_ASPWE|nr:uncharacterized protein ASPWEDRAFT_40575 [Aspergillus wentii DTO 134E9]OJJ35374.1 hypothetical protein ASPWEDRAFT_40575 [Aspergillus wentii DTO 134E9]